MQQDCFKLGFVLVSLIVVGISAFLIWYAPEDND